MKTRVLLAAGVALWEHRLPEGRVLRLHGILTALALYRATCDFRWRS